MIAVHELAHLKEKASWDKKVLLLITDGEDNASRITLEQLVRSVERSDVMIYTVGLLGGESSRSMRRAKRALESIAKATGGSTYFPKGLEEVQVAPVVEEVRQPASRRPLPRSGPPARAALGGRRCETTPR